MSNAYCSPADLFDRFDKRPMLELSNDLNMPDGELQRINRLLDSQASRLESALYVTWALPLVISAGSLSVAVAAGSTSFQTTAIPRGIFVGSRIAVGPDTINAAEVVEVTAITGVVPNFTVTISGSSQAGGFQYPHGQSAPIGLIPGVLTDWVATMTASQLFGRRTSRPEDMDKDVEMKEKWLEALITGVVSIPGVGRQNGPVTYSCLPPGGPITAVDPTL